MSGADRTTSRSGTTRSTRSTAGGRTPGSRTAASRSTSPRSGRGRTGAARTERSGTGRPETPRAGSGGRATSRTGAAPRARTPRSRPPRRLLGVTVRTWAVGVVLLAGVLTAVAWLTPVLGVRTVTVTGTVATDRSAVLAAVAVARGTPLLQVDLDAAAGRVARIPTVGRVEVRRELPGTLEVVVTERRATLAVAEADGTHLLDATGVDFATGAPVAGVPVLTTPTPGPADAATGAALAVVAALPPSLTGQVAEVRAPSADAVSLVLLDGRSVVFGTAADAARKAAVAAAVLSQPGDVVDVTSPDLPTTR